MPLTLGLPYPVCLAAAKFARKRSLQRPAAIKLDQGEYFREQHRSTGQLIARFANTIDFRNRVVLDVGSGLGGRAPWFIENGARHCYCIDVNRQELTKGHDILLQQFPKLADHISFVHPEDLKQEQFADAAFLVDCFEHLVHPVSVLKQVSGWLRPGALLWIGSIGWYNYMASHCATHIPIPWSQVFFSEQAILRTIRTILREPDYVPNIWEQMEGIERWDHVQTLRDRPGEPLNMLSLRQIKKVISQSNLEVQRFEAHGFSGARSKLLHKLAFLSKVPVLDELLHSYYTVHARRH